MQAEKNQSSSGNVHEPGCVCCRDDREAAWRPPADRAHQEPGHDLPQYFLPCAE